MYSCLPFVDDSVIVKGKLARNAALFYESAYIKCSIEESMIFL